MSSSPSLNPGVPWPATDALGRRLPVSPEIGLPRADRTVGIFYFLWLESQHAGPYDVSKILAADPDALKKQASPPWGGPEGTPHHWGESIFGYYLSQDDAVLRKHAQMLSDAGIDTLIFDTTNAITYREVYFKLCEVFTAVRSEGGRTPQFCFMLNTEAAKTAQKIYEELYQPGHYSDLWFQWRGKPLMICDPKDVSAQVLEFFTLRGAHWPFTMVNTPHAWHWEAAHPQPYGFTDDEKVAEQVNVSVAQNLNVKEGTVTAMSSGDARGRSFHDGAIDRSPGAIEHGLNFQEQWKRALELDPPFIMVTGWNEWIAGNFHGKEGGTYFVDQFDAEHSRDIEPRKGGHGDNYYYQLVANVPRYKGAPALPPAIVRKSLAIDGKFAKWQEVQPEFPATGGVAVRRDYPGWGGIGAYVNETARNEIVCAKVCCDEQHTYFYVRTRNPLTPSTDEDWMILLIDTDGDAANGWLGYDQIIRPRVGDFPFVAAGCELELAVPRALMRGKFDFKWIDNIAPGGEASRLTLDGSAAPHDRFNFRAELP